MSNGRKGELQGTARCSQELGPGQEDVWYLSGLHLRVLNPMTTPLAAFSWLLTLREVGTLFWGNDCMPAPQEVCIQRSLPESWAVGKEIGKLLRQKCWIQRRRKDRVRTGFSLVPRGTAQGLLQTRSLVELTEG